MDESKPPISPRSSRMRKSGAAIPDQTLISEWIHRSTQDRSGSIHGSTQDRVAGHRPRQFAASAS